MKVGLYTPYTQPAIKKWAEPSLSTSRDMFQRSTHFGYSHYLPKLHIPGLAVQDNLKIENPKDLEVIKDALRMSYYAQKSKHPEQLGQYLHLVGRQDTVEDFVEEKISIRKQHTSDSARTYHAVISDYQGPVGYFSLVESNVYDGEKNHPNVGKVNIMGVRPDMENKGLEGWMLEVALEKAKMFGYNELISWSDTGNSRSVATQHGFRPFDPGVAYTAGTSQPLIRKVFTTKSSPQT